MKLYISFVASAIFCLSACTSSKTYITDLDYTRIDLESELTADQDIEKTIAPYRKTLGNEMDEVIALNEINLKKQKPNSYLGNWFSDVLHIASEDLTEMEVDFAAQNYGGIRIPVLPKGPITVGKIYELMPFDNVLIIVEIDGSVTKKLVNRIADYGGWPISKGLSFELTKEGAAENILIGGEPLDMSKTYRIALPDYVANGGDDCEFLKGQKNHSTGIFIRDAVINYLKQFPEDRLIDIDQTKRIITN